MAEEKMKFEYFGGEQKSPEWFQLRLGKVTASNLWRWMSVSKSKANPGAPLKERLDYEKELMFEHQFNTSFEKYVTSAMQDGIDFEDFARQQYEKVKNVRVEKCGAWFNEYFVASPDGTVGEDGLVEIKVLADNSFTAVLMDGVPDKYEKQIQGQLMASGRKWCDFVAINLNTKRMKIIRVYPDPEQHEWFELILQETLVAEPLSTDDVYSFADDMPESGEVDLIPQSNTTKGW